MNFLWFTCHCVGSASLLPCSTSVQCYPVTTASNSFLYQPANFLLIPSFLQPFSSKQKIKPNSAQPSLNPSQLLFSESAVKFFQWRFGGSCSFWHWLSSSASSFSFSFLPRFLPFTSTPLTVLFFFTPYCT